MAGETWNEIAFQFFQQGVTAGAGATGAGGASTDATATGSLAQGRATTSAPSYSNGTRGALSLDTAGSLRVLPPRPTAASRIPSSAASTNATVAKASAGEVFMAVGYNANAAARYLKIYNKATAPTVGTDTPILTLPLVPQAGFAFDFPTGFALATGISYALTTGAADADTGAVSAADILGLNLVYA